jgi:putative ABC transport system permease protein
MNGVLAKISADVRRRRLQSLILTLIIVLAAAISTMALTMLTQAGAPYDHAFAQQRGAHLEALFQGNLVQPAQLAATAHLPGVSAAAGPWPAAEQTFEATTLPPSLAHVDPFGLPKVGLRVIGRADPGGAVNRLQLVEGHWPRAPGEIVLTRAFAELVDGLAGGSNVPLLGTHLRTVDAAHNATFVVVGEAIDVNEADASVWTPQQAWVRPADLVALNAPGIPEYAMFYRFHQAATTGQVGANLAAISATLPSGALYRSYSYFEVRTVATIGTSLILTFLVAFALFALVAAALITANVVAGAVLANYREIGIMKAIGFTPRQVVAALAGQMLAPALLGCIIGIPLGALLGRSILISGTHAMGLPAPSPFDPVSDLLALAGVLLVVALAACIPAMRAGRLSAIQAITEGTAPGTPRGSWLGRRLQRLGVPRVLSLGAGEAFARPLRGILTVAVILIGVATVAFASGMHATMATLNAQPALHSNDYVGGSYQLEVNPSGSVSDGAIMHALAAQPGTEGVVAFADTFVTVPGLADSVQAVFIRGDATRLGYGALSGRWYGGPNQAVAAAALLQAAHLQVGNHFSITANGRTIPVRLVGTEFDFTSRGRVMRLDWSSLTRLDPHATPYHYAVLLRPGVDPVAYGQRLSKALPGVLDISINNTKSSALVTVLDGIVTLLALVLLSIAVVGVFNTMVLGTRERIHDTAVLKTIGMSPRQIVAMVVTGASVLGLLGGILGLPLGVWLQGAVLNLIGSLAGNTVPLDLGTVFTPAGLLLPLATGILAAIAGALLPALWAARATVVEVLHTE